jgi:hypothetical protein
MMPHKFVDLWGWVNHSRSEAWRSGDETRMRLTNLYQEAWDIIEEDPHRALALHREGVQLAQQLQEPCWQLFHKYWCIETYMFYLLDMKEAKRLAVDLAVEARKPVYEHCPIRAQIYRTLIESYLFSDPIGYADQIRENLGYLENQVPLDEDTWRLIPSRRYILALCFDQFEEAHRHALTYLERSQNDDFRLYNAYIALCRITFEFRELDRLFDYAQTGEIHARRENRRKGIAILQIYQAICRQLRGQEKDARRLVRQAQRHIGSIAADEEVFESLAWYYEICGEFENALNERTKMISFAQKGGYGHEEIEARIECCKLMVKLGLPIEKEATEARDRAKQMLKPDHYLRKLDTLETGKM